MGFEGGQMFKKILFPKCNDHAAMLLLMSLFTLLFISNASAQIPDEFTNLKVLPRTIEKPELLKVMKGFTFALGVRCSFCHVGKEGAPLSKYDFAADDKPEKGSARIMMQMTADINKLYLPKLEEKPEHLVTVSCVTCHHGLSKPRMLEDTLKNAIAKGGVPAAKKKYQELKKEYYGTYSYDFSEDPLNHLARDLSEDGKTTDAIDILKFNESMFPKSDEVEFLLAELYMKNNDRRLALQHYKKCLALSPDNDYVKKKIEELSKPPSK
jgi:hypothetical protein